jgi:anti-sigma28 factor (negative regulator of flagellin synthesis)
MTSGEHPMADPPSGADAAHVMTTAARYADQQDTSDRPAAVAGRFGRQVPLEARALDSVAETRKVQVDQMRNRMERGGYRVDSHAVAAAIIARLKAGRTVSGGARSPSSSSRPPAR